MLNNFRSCVKRCFVVFALMLTGHCTAGTNEAVETLAHYFDLLVTGNLESATNLWTESAIERSSRFGITYTDIPLKIDCTSPIVGDLEKMRGHLQPPTKQVTELAGGDFIRLHYSAVVEGKLVKQLYYAVFDSENYWLIYPQDYYCRSWPIKESRYFRVHVHPDVEEFLNPAALDEADKFVEQIVDSLDISKSDLKTISNKKIEYFYCDSDKTVKQILGVRMKGAFDLPSNDIISAFFPHNHEVTHLLIHLKLKKLPLYTHPLLGEGLAVYYGGRWGQAPSALMGLGAFLYRENIVGIDSLLTVSRFNNHASSDIAYPVAGLFTAYLLDGMGWKGFEQLYRALSGSMEEMKAQSDSMVKSELLNANGNSTWESLLNEFGSFATRQTTDEAIMQPGRIDKGDQLVRQEGLVISSDKEWLVFEFTGNSSQPPTGNLLFGKAKRLSDGKSIMFEEQYLGSRRFEGYRFGVRFDRNEAGLYDYAANQVVAKYIHGITPSEEYYDATSNKITIKLKKNLVGKDLPSGDNCKLIPL